MSALFSSVGDYLSSRAVSSQVFSAQVSLTSVFGMGTGGPSPLSTPTNFLLKKKVSKEHSGYSLLTAFFKEALDIVNQIARFVKGNFTLRIQTPSETGRGIKPEARI